MAETGGCEKKLKCKGKAKDDGSGSLASKETCQVGERGHAMFIDRNLLARLAQARSCSRSRSRSRSCSRSLDCWLLTAGEDLREMGSDGTEGVYDVMFDAAALEAYASIHYVT